MMLTQKTTRTNFRQAQYQDNLWLSQCCWSCKYSDISYDLKKMVCQIVRQPIAGDKVCDFYILNPKNPYRSNC